MKFVRLLIPTILILVICVISYNTYNKAKTVSNKPLSVIPSHSSILLKINKPHKTFNYFNNKKIWQKLSDVLKGDKINYNLSLIEDFYKNRSLLKVNILPEDIAEGVYFFASSTIFKIGDLIPSIEYKLSNTINLG